VGNHLFVIFAVLDVSLAVNLCINRGFLHLYRYCWLGGLQVSKLFCVSRIHSLVSILMTRRRVIGLFSVRNLADWNITFWSSTAIYGVKMTGDSSTIELLFDGKHSFNITNAVTVDNLVFFTDWRSK